MISLLEKCKLDSCQLSVKDCPTILLEGKDWNWAGQSMIELKHKKGKQGNFAHSATFCLVGLKGQIVLLRYRNGKLYHSIVAQNIRLYYFWYVSGHWSGDR